MLTWIANFLEGRKIKVKVNGHLSDTVEPDNGTPKGSVISPLIFNLIMNTLNMAIDAHNKQSPPGDRTELAQFVDDGATWVTSPNPHSVLLKGQKVLEVIEKWSNEWGFTINPNKTLMLMVCRQPYLKVLAKSNKVTPELKLCGKALEIAPTAKFLGMYFDQYLTWHHHINNLVNRCEKDINLLRLISGTNWGANKKTKLMLYNSLIMSKINYGSTAYASACKSQLKRLDVIQSKALRVVTGAYKTTNKMAVLVETAQLPLDITREVNMLKYWARSSRLGENLPINNTIKALKECPSTIERVRNGHTGRKELRTQPYTREVNRLLDKYQLSEVNIQEPVFSYNAGIMVTTPDLSLKCFINKTEDTTQAKHITEMHIMKHYRSHYHIYTDGSKNPSENKAGAAFVVFDPYSKEICSSALKLDPRVSIFTCEATAIQHALKWIPENMPRNIAIFTDSLSVLQSINTGRSQSRSDIIVDIIHKISHLSKIGIRFPNMGPESCRHYGKRKGRSTSKARVRKWSPKTGQISSI
ncbi:uncharacterized protein LOC128556576 [Mercenaria mercenaria]|uniref:uncharacterized protein LOC128556576 n=1 Tax=Mercenaria mercenaria TaxID=6596 RepID=UPI00234F5C3F|nr:uncharacterized protein LOC128556576 [Mercenaria mercenaria]